MSRISVKVISIRILSFPLTFKWRFKSFYQTPILEVIRILILAFCNGQTYTNQFKRAKALATGLQIFNITPRSNHFLK